MKQLILCLLLLTTSTVFADDKKNYEKLKKAPDAATCKQDTALCLAYKYIQHYHSNAKEAEWFQNTAVSHYFDYKITYQNEREKGEIFLSFESYSDGLEWKYWEDSTLIRIKDPLKLVDSKSAQKKIQEKLESEFDKDIKIDRIQKIITRSLMQNQQTPREYYSIEEKIQLKVKANGKTFVFKSNGDSP
ncbi:MAG TPA: hypothetical protein PK079_07400 [Leptospiraceae bacterium]|nr:hypothetical protein [Leptospiraceae bacterium]HMW05791.1 hypothetical protein [Leptospiraceae bacterium]HMX32620.1 hypothetical protein [Leptospiraceae bacterium]HMY33334.1 hypothetical protein [Leptospiraceae bacterium]HMZ66208.1 hypothetical protein [Leptospiraceae bacterium]